MATTEHHTANYSHRVSQALQSLEVAEEMWQSQEDLATSMRKGFLHLAKARLVLGRNSVSPFDCREEFDANVRVLTTKDSKSSSGTGLRAWEKHEESGMDPKLLFGGLIPPELKSVQTEFKKAVEVAIQSANIAMRQLQLTPEEGGGGASSQPPLPAE